MVVSILKKRGDNSGTKNNTKTNLKNAILSEITQLKQQLEAHQKLESPNLESLTRKYQRIIDARLQLYNEL